MGGKIEVSNETLKWAETRARTCQRRLGNVCGDDHLPSAVNCRLEDFGLQISRHLRVDWQHSQRSRVVQLVESLCEIEGKNESAKGIPSESAGQETTHPQ